MLNATYVEKEGKAVKLGISTTDRPLSMPASAPLEALPRVPTKQPPPGEAAGWDSSRLASPGPPLPAPAARLLSAGTRARGPWKGHLPNRWGGRTPDPGSQLETSPLETGNTKSCYGASDSGPFQTHAREERTFSYPAYYPSLLTSAHLYSSPFLNASL